VSRALAGASALIAALAAGPAAANPPAATRPAPARLLVEAREFNLALSRPTVRAGRAIVQLVNRGEDPHDLRIVRSGRRIGTIAELRPGKVGEWEGRLRRGRYRLYCTLEGHRAAGMKATLRAR
jgi:plastocyanin